jgi:sulfur carrier protein ThiS
MTSNNPQQQGQNQTPGVEIEFKNDAPAQTTRPAPAVGSDVMITAGVPGKMEKFAMASGSTVADVLNKAGLNAEGYDVRLGGVAVRDLNTPIRDGQTLLLLRPVRGNV